jgi:ATP-dependent DNA helicase RecG
MDQTTLQEMINQGESLTVEFKSDQGPLDDGDLLDTVVCMANSQGGLLLIGVENDGAITSLHPKHRTRPELLAAFINSRTVPPLSVQVSFETLLTNGNKIIAVLRIPAASQPIATSDGRLLIRYLDTHGQPGCRPLYPHELPGWRAERGQADFTAQPIAETIWNDLDPLEFARLRRMVEENRGDATLLDLADEEIAGALGLVRGEPGRLRPTLAGLLLVGKEVALRQYLPSHEVAFQVLHGTDVAVNEFRRWPLLRIHEWLMQAIDVRNEEQELMVGSFRVGVPRYDQRGVREAVNNALIHRDYTRLGAIHLQLHDDYVLITNPGGFVMGVNAGNLLVSSPRPRNPILADSFKRVGLVERTGRGVGIIYAGQLRNGRPTPNYTRSTEVSVTVILDSRLADLNFVQLTIQANRQLGRPPSVDELLALWQVWREATVEVPILAPHLHKEPARAAEVLATLAAASILQADGPVYRLNPGLTEKRGEPVPPLDPEATILAYVRTYGRITRRQTTSLTALSENQVRYHLRLLVERGDLELVGTGRGAYYRRPQTENKR